MFFFCVFLKERIRTGSVIFPKSCFKDRYVYNTLLLSSKFVIRYTCVQITLSCFFFQQKLFQREVCVDKLLSENAISDSNLHSRNLPQTKNVQTKKKKEKKIICIQETYFPQNLFIKTSGYKKMFSNRSANWKRSLPYDLCKRIDLLRALPTSFLF